jgi:cytochrome c
MWPVRLMVMTTVRCGLLPICLTLAVIGPATAQDDVERGRSLITTLCGKCHAVGRTGTSPHAGAPTFRSLDDHTDLDEFMDRLRSGLQSTHADMPSFRFSREDAQAAVTYLRSVQGP